MVIKKIKDKAKEKTMFMNLKKKKPRNRHSIDLKISMSESAASWQQAQEQSNTLARYNAYLNRLSVATLLPWLEDFISTESIPRPSIGFTEDSSVLELVNGNAIQLGKHRFVLIPTDDMESEEFIVPQEWVDIPSWMGDYYLAVGVNLDGDEEDCWIRLWGFATHQQIKNEGEYDVNLRSYRLKLDQLIQDLTVMPMTFGIQQRETVHSLSPLSAGEANQLIQNLGNSEIYSPRLRSQVPFEKWAALLENDQWRKQLYDCRMGKPPKKKPVNLRQWLHNLAQETQKAIADGWGNLEDLWSEPELSPVRGDRLTSFAPRGPQAAIASTIRLLESDRPDLRFYAIGMLGEIGQGNPEAIAALTQFLRNEPDKETRKQAALSLGKVDPGNVAAAIQKAKLINLGMQLQEHQVALIVAIMPQTNDKFQVFVEVRSQKETKLPANLELSVISTSGEVIKNLKVKTRIGDDRQPIDDSIHLPSFTPPQGSHFRVRVALNEVSIIEDFMV
jgi:hypothetical protein